MMLVTSIYTLRLLVESVLNGSVDKPEPFELGNRQNSFKTVWLRLGRDREPPQAAALDHLHPQSPLTANAVRIGRLESEPAPIEPERAAIAAVYTHDSLLEQFTLWTNPSVAPGVPSRIHAWLGEPMPETWLLYGTEVRTYGAQQSAQQLHGDGFYGLRSLVLPGRDKPVTLFAGVKLCDEREPRFDLLVRSERFCKHPLAPTGELISRCLDSLNGPEPQQPAISSLYVYFKPSRYWGTVHGSVVRFLRYYSDADDPLLDHIVLLATLFGYTALEPQDVFVLLTTLAMSASALYKRMRDRSAQQSSPLVMAHMFALMTDQERDLFTSLVNIRSDETRKLWFRTTARLEGTVYPYMDSLSASELSMRELYDTWMLARSQLGKSTARWDELDWQRYSMLAGSEGAHVQH